MVGKAKPYDPRKRTEEFIKWWIDEIRYNDVACFAPTWECDDILDQLEHCRIEIKWER